MNRRHTRPAGLPGETASNGGTGESPASAVERSRSPAANNESKRNAQKPDARAGASRRKKRFVL